MVAITRQVAALSQALNWLQAPFALATRLYVSQVFLASGWLKLTNWSQTVGLFETEYHTPVLPPTLAAVVGTFGELFFPILLILGIGGRIGALGLFAVNLMAVISYWPPCKGCRQNCMTPPRSMARALGRSFATLPCR